MLSSSQADSPSPDIFSDQGGYYKFPNGLIFQWGNFRDSGNVDWYTPHYKTFIIPFPHKCLNVSLSTKVTGYKETGLTLNTNSSWWAMHDVGAQLVEWDNNGFYYLSQLFSEGHYVDLEAPWFAIGY